MFLKKLELMTKVMINNWEEVLRKELEENRQQEMLMMGKGMRKRNANVNYIHDNEEVDDKMSEYHDTSNPGEEVKSEDDELNSLVEETQIIRKRDAKYKRKNKSYFFIQRMTKEERNEEVKAMDIDETNSDIIFMGESKSAKENVNKNLDGVDNIKHEQDKPRKILKVNDDSHDPGFKVATSEDPYPESKFDLELVMKYTENQAFIDLIKLNNERNFDDFI